MSLIVASTTDTQAEVNAAAGVTAPPKPSEAPPVPPAEEPETDGDPETPDDEPDQDDSEPQTPQRRLSNVQRRIDKLTRDKYQAVGRIQELERRLQEQYSGKTREQPAAPQAQPQQPPGRPQESQFERYEDYIEAITDWKSAQNIAAFRREQEQQALARQQEQQEWEWHQRVRTQKAAMPDFQAALEEVADIGLPLALQAAILEHEHGPRLAYELAKNRGEFERIASLSPTAAVRELGKFEARLDLNGHKPPAVSKAPPPINPVGQGSARSTKSPDEMPYQEYKRWRLKNGAR